MLVALPFLESAAPRGAAAGAAPKRLVIMFSANGTVKDNWRPSGSETAFTLGPILQPLAKHQKHLIVIDGVNDESSYSGNGDAGHSSGMGHLLTGQLLLDVGHNELLGGGISVDQYLAGTLGRDTRLGSLELCVEDHPADVRSRMCYTGPAQPVPPESDPRSAFERVFTPLPADLLDKRLSILDTVNDDIKSLQKQLGADDQKKLDQHLTSLRDVEQRLPLQAKVNCPGATPPPAIDISDFQAVGKLQMDILALALQCDMTRIATLQWSVSRSQTVMTWLGLNETHHDLSHHSPTEADAQAKLTAINTWYAQQMAYLVSALEASPVGDQTLLDQCAVVWVNEMSSGPDHNRDNLPIVIAGKCGGALKTGRWLDYNPDPNVTVGHPKHNQFWLSMCHAMGVNAKTFGDPDFCPGPLTDLHA